MDLLTFVVLVVSMASSQAIKCHDCTSWNPYCREKVNEPFSEAVATVDCDQTHTCFIKKEESGVISRGCTDWWMETQVDINYEGCRTQTVQWLGKQTWCFCKSDHCNGASVEEVESGLIPPPPPPKVDPSVERNNRIQDDGWVGWDFSQDWQQWDKTDQTAQQEVQEGGGLDEWKNWDEIVTVPWSEWEHDGTGRKGTTPPPVPAPINPDVNQRFNEQDKTFDNSNSQNKYENSADKTFDDINPEYGDLGISRDPAWQVWWWHADSDRPHFDDFDRTWKAPNWVQDNDGQGWDFPVDQRDVQTTTTERVWTWGKGWGNIFPWWSGRRLPLTTPRPALATTTQQQQQTTAERVVVIQNEGVNTLDEVVEKPQDTNDIEISDPEFFCWDCYSDSPLCGTRVDTQKAHYLGKTACPSTNKCFVRRQGDVVFRGCADGWMSSVISHDYVGCRTQMLWGKPVEWCFCTASLCNSDSMDDIAEKYKQVPHPFKGNVTTTPEQQDMSTDSSTVELSTEESTSVETSSSEDKTEEPTKRQTDTGNKSRFLTVLSQTQTEH